MPAPRRDRSHWRGLVLAAALAGLGGIAVAPVAHATTPAAEPSAEARGSTIRMVVGGSYVDTDGNTWTSGSGYRGGTTATFTNPIAGTDKDALYQRERYGIDGYDVKVPSSGTYRTTLNLAELWFTSAGQRVFDVKAEGAAELSGVDIFARAGGTNKALQLTFDTVVTDGSLSLDFVDRVNQAKISSIRVERFSTTTPPPPPPPPGYSKVASVHQNTGESWADACIRTMTYGYTGCVRYLNPTVRLAWEPNLKELAAKAGNRRVDIQLTAKVYSHDGFAQVLENVPAAWKPTFKFNIFQEPEDNLETAAEQADYRADYSDAATLTRQFGFQLPWLELQEWGVNPTNNKGWNIGGFFPPAKDYQGVLWSLFEFHERDVLDGQVANIKAAMAKYAPGKPWGLMAAEYAIPVAHVNDASQRAQAAWLTHAFDLTRAKGSTGFAWFNMRYNNGAWTEGRVEENPYALAAFKATGN